MSRGVSIIMLSYNRSSFTKVAIQKMVENLDHPVEKFVLVDNGSTDGTTAWVKQFFLNYSLNHQDVVNRVQSWEIIANETNKGIAVAQNQGCLACSKDNDVVMISNDIFLGPDWLFPLVKERERHQQLGVKLGWLSPYLSPELQFDEIINSEFRKNYFDQWYRHVINCHDADRLKFTIDQLYGGNFDEFSRQFVERNKGKIWDEAPSMCFYWTREAIDEVGLFDERFSEFNGVGGFGSEDVDLYFRFNNAGFFRITVWESFAHHLVTGTTRKLTLDNPDFAYKDILTGNLCLRKWCPILDQKPVNYPLDIFPGASKRSYDKWLLRTHNTEFGDINKLDLGLTKEEQYNIDKIERESQGIFDEEELKLQRII